MASFSFKDAAGVAFESALCKIDNQLDDLYLNGGSDQEIDRLEARRAVVEQAQDDYLAGKFTSDVRDVVEAWRLRH